MEERNAHLLLIPKAKKGCKFKREYPFPLLLAKGKKNESGPVWKIAEGFLQGNCVLVHDEESMKRLYCMGFFGKGTKSKWAPEICNPKKKIPKSATSHPIDEIIDVVSSDNKGSNSIKLKISHKDEGCDENVIIIPDSSDSDDGKKSNNSDEKESLQLSFQEAYFLSYGLGCLIVKEKCKPLDLATLWIRFCKQTENFPVLYTAYHHFRSKGWIVKSGLKYGTDYVLYKDGPPYYHATYSVIVQTVNENLNNVGDNRELTWGSLAALGRVNTAAGKGILILYVIKPNNMTEGVLNTPSCVSQFKLEEVLHKQWVAKKNR